MVFTFMAGKFIYKYVICKIRANYVLKKYQFPNRSVHGFADTDLPTLINDLKKEEDNLCAHRGLVPGTTTQTFILSFNQSFKSLYDEFMKQNVSCLRKS